MFNVVRGRLTGSGWEIGSRWLCCSYPITRFALARRKRSGTLRRESAWSHWPSRLKILLMLTLRLESESPSTASYFSTMVSTDAEFPALVDIRTSFVLDTIYITFVSVPAASVTRPFDATE